MLICAVVSAANALSRYVFDLSSNAWLELQWYMFGAIVLLGAPYLLQTNGHVRVDIFYTRLSDRKRLWLDAAGFGVFVLPFSAIMAWLSWPWFVDAWQVQEVSANAGGLIRWPIKLLIPVGFGLLFAQTISEIIKRICALAGGGAIDTRYERPVQ